jgi:hypothetical protein
MKVSMEFKTNEIKMMRSINKLTILAISILLISITFSCGKYAGDVDANYVGAWYSDTLINLSTGHEEYQYIIIDGKKNSEYGYRCGVNCGGCECYITVKGNAKINKKRSTLFIGTSNNTTPLSIEEQPTATAGNWKMKIEGRYYYRQ